MTLKDKIFRDPLYGYISIPEDFCQGFIDTPIFQRLRRIEQTSMRVLYPSAHHDRFAHSIGVFHLGRIAFRNLIKNSESFYDGVINKEQWDFLENTFLIACLMHDCGHSPFSHTFEHFYLYKRETAIKEHFLTYYKEEPGFSYDYDSSSPAAHEKISALVLLSQYSDIILTFNACPRLAARMIMGCKFEITECPFQRFQNKLISILNGPGIDVDSLDYIQRDSWASGVSNVNIDYQRLLSSIMIRPDENGIPQIVFKKQVLSVIENITIGRNFLYKWIYSHHKVNYEQYLLEKITDKINHDSEDEFCLKAFSFESFLEPQLFNNLSYFLTTDDDIIYTLKQYYTEDSRIEELFSRRYKYKAIWKTYFEFNDAYFESLTPKNLMKIFSKIDDGALSRFYDPNDYICLPSEPKLKSIEQNDFFIEINGRLIDASKASNLKSENLNYFLIYIKDILIPEKNNLIKRILSLQS